MGAYGDPAALPFAVWEAVLGDCEGVADTGYTHQWRTCDVRFARYLMASVDNVDDWRAAKAKGYRTFRVRRPGEALQTREVACPASAESGFKTTCERCMACGGHRAKARADIVIVVHGAGARSF